MEIPGDYWKPYIGLVNQATFVPITRLIPFKMSRMNLDPESTGVPTDHNAVPNFHTTISAKRRTTGKMENLSFDPTYNIYGITPFGAIPAAAFRLQEGFYFRMMCVPDSSIPDPAIAGGSLGVPIFGAPGELLASFASLPANSFGLAYVFLGLRVTKINHMADASAGQPFSFEFETVYPYMMPNESMATISAYGFSNTVGVGGFF